MLGSFPYSHADYFAFLSAVALLLAGTHAVSLRQVTDSSRRWAWLAGMTISAAVATIMQTMLIDLGVSRSVILMQAAALSVSAVCAVGYWLESRGRDSIRTRTAYQWRAVAISAVWLSAVLVMIALGIALGTWLLVGTVVGAGISVAFELSSEVRRDVNKRGLKTASVGLVTWLLCQVGVQFALAKQPPSDVLGWFLAIGALGAMVLAGGLGRYMAGLTDAWSHGDRGVIRGRIRGLLILLLTVGLLAGFGLTDLLGNLGAKRVVDELETRTHTTAAAMDSAQIARLRGTADDQDTHAYRDLSEVLALTLNANPDIAHLYLVRGVAGRVVILVEAPLARESTSVPGGVVGDATPELHDALLAGQPLLEKPDADQSGAWYSAVYPVVDPTTGEVLAHFGMDLPAQRVSGARLQYRLAGISLSLAVVALILGFYVVLQMTRAAATAISGSEMRFRSLFEHAPDAIMVVSRESQRLLGVNPRGAQWLGGTREALVGEPITRFAHCKRGCGGGGCVIDGDAMLEERCVLRSVDGSELDVELSTVEIDYDGAPAIVVFARDTSMRARAEAAISGQIGFSTLVTDISRKFVDATPDTVDTEIESALARIGVYSNVDRVYVFRFDDHAHMTNTHEWLADGIPSRREAFQNAPTAAYPWVTSRILSKRELYVPDVEGDSNLDTEERLSLQSSGIRSMLIVPITIFGMVVGMLGFDSVRGQKDWPVESIPLLRMVADIIGAAQRRTEAESELMTVSQAIGQSPVAVVITDCSGDIEYVNPTFTRITGYTLDEARGQNPRVLKSGLTPDETYKELWSQILRGEVWTGEFVNKRKDGTPYWARATISAMRTSDGEITHLIGVQEDVTEARAAQDDLKTAKIQAESANRAKSEFLATMSHEIRTPMNAIIGMSELLQDTELTRQQARYVDVFRRAGESLLGLINSILDLSKIEADRLEMEHIPFDVCDVAETAASVIGVQAAEKGIELLYRIKPGTPTNLLGDPERLRQVLINLLGNAVKFTDVGQVLLSIQQQPDQAQGNLLITVSDTGVGIAEDKLDTVFESFSQADASTTRRYGGTGLGLTISRRLTELMGGRMRVESTLGEGTTFLMEIPFLVAREEVKAAVRESTESLEGRRVLIVDDNETNRFILREIMSAWGMRTSDAPDGQAGLEALRFAARNGDPYDALVLDHQMPVMDGIELLERIRTDKAISRTAAIMLSSDAHGRDMARSNRLNLVDYLFKPVRRNELKESLQAALRSGWRAVEAVKTDEEPLAQTRSLRILLVEDSEDNRFLIRSYLAKTEHTVVEAVDGQEAFDAMTTAEQPFDLVLMDMQMPVKDGLTATREIREWESDSAVAPTMIVALSAFALKEERERSLNAGCDAHLTKPIKKKELLKALDEYSRSESHVC